MMTCPLRLSYAETSSEESKDPRLHWKPTPSAIMTC